MSSSHDFLDDDLEAAMGSMGGNSLGAASPPPMAPPNMMPGYYPVANYPISPAMSGMGTTDAVPIYKRPAVTFFTGAVIVGVAWFYFDFVRPRMKKAKAKADK